MSTRQEEHRWIRVEAKMTTSSFSDFKISPELQALLKHWINLHRVLWFLTLVSFFIAWNRGLALLYGLFALLVALLLVSYAMPRWQLRKLHVTRRLTGEFTVGHIAHITYGVTTGGSRYHVELCESLLFTQEQEHHFFFDKIPGRAACTMQFECCLRGCFQLRDIQLSSAYPFGVVEHSKSIPTEPVEIMVFPRVVTLTRIPLPLAADVSTSGKVQILHKGGRDEFAGVREYVHGDAMNRIHWSVSARHQNLVVKEYEKTDRPALLVVLDCRKIFNVGDGSRSTFEYSITLAASMIRFASREGMPCYLAARGEALQELAIQPHRADLYTLYELLARLKSDGRQPYYLTVEQAHQRLPQVNLIATFRLDSDPKLPRLSSHVTQIDMEMDVQSFRASSPARTHKGFDRDGKRLIYRVGADTQLEDFFNEN
jgi:uncharacterized protein (DUF58 family)